jgi:hypothetical protein
VLLTVHNMATNTDRDINLRQDLYAEKKSVMKSTASGIVCLMIAVLQAPAVGMWEQLPLS